MKCVADDWFRDSDIQVLKTYGAAPYAAKIKGLEKELKDVQQRVNEKIGMTPVDVRFLVDANII